MRIAIAITCLLVSVSAQAEEFEYEVKEKIVYTKVGDREVLLDAFVPKPEGKYPAVLVVHGGAWKHGNRKQLRGYAKSLTKMGCVCFAIDYRLAPKHKHPAQIDDCRAAVKFIRENAKDYKVDPDRLGAIGYSAGGHLVSLLATTGKAPSEENGVDTRLQVVAAGGAPTEFRDLPNDGKYLEYWLGGTISTAAEKFKTASSTVFVDKDDAPVFFFNGTKDRVVPLKWSTALYESLKESGVKTEIHKIEGAGHLEAAANPKALKAAYAFLMSELKE